MLVEVGLHFHHVIEREVEVLALVDRQLDEVARRALDREGLVGLVVGDGDRRTLTDLDRVALIADFAFVVRVRDRTEDGGDR